MTTSAEHSLWLEDGPSYAAPAGDVDADVAVVGGGIAGITAALRLQQAGARVVVLEAVRVASGVTGNTTAKVTALQSTILSTVRSRHGADGAAEYAAASAAAVEDVAALVAEHGIDCGFERRPAVTYAAEPSEVASVRAEHDAAAEAGLPVRWDTGDAGLPFPVHGAAWLDDQVKVHPVRYVRGLAEAFVAAGGVIHEDTRVLAVREGDPCRLRTPHGEVRAPQVVVATHYPILDRGLFFARLKAERSYCVGVRVRGAVPRAMAISAGSNSRSVQWHDDVVVVGGEGHPAGATKHQPERFEALERYAATHWDVTEPVARWSAQDPVPYDHLPMIGPLRPRSGRLWVATGWQKWGLTSATFAARILAERVQGREHQWSARFSPSRVSPRSTPEIAQLGSKFSALMVADRVKPDLASAESLEPGEGRLVRDGAGKAAAYRDPGGELHVVSARCTHLGCLVRFNAAEVSWDCPCHGSRFDVDGTVLEGPAVSPLKSRRP